MGKKLAFALALVITLILSGASPVLQAQRTGTPARPQGPCDIYAAAGDPCVAAHSTTRALYAAYTGPLYQILRQSDGKTLDIGLVQPSSKDPGGYADAAAQDTFCANTHCWISKLYDQSPKHNDLVQPPRGGFSGPALGGFDNLPLADAAPISLMGHKVYGLFIAPGMGLRQNDAKGTAVDDQAEGQYWVINGHHFNSGCCFDYGNAETDSRDDGNGTMETTYFGDGTGWYHGNPPGPWVMTDQENNLVGCVNPDGSKLCASLPIVSWRFVTAMAKGEPHHWTSLGGDAQRGPLQVMFDGPRIDATYDPMRKQGAILLGNGGDNSNGSQGTFYEGAMTAAGTFPNDATDQLVQANVTAAHYAVQPLSIAPASAAKMPPGLQTFSPGTSQDTLVTFTNTTATPANAVKLSLAVPAKGWTATVAGTNSAVKAFPEPVAPGASVSATFHLTSGPATINADLVAHASWHSPTGPRSETIAEKIRNVSPVKINEFRIGTNALSNLTNSFIELYNAGSADIDLSRWSLTQHQEHQAIFSAVTIPAGTKLPAHGFYLLGLSNSGLAVPARAGDTTLFLRSTADMKPGDTLNLDTGSGEETHRIATLGTAAGNSTTLWQPVPDGPVITIPAGSTNVPVTSTAGFTVGEKIALGYGATYPAVAQGVEHDELVTVTAIGKPGTQAFLAADAVAGATNLKVTSVANITAGDKIRLDIDSVGHGIETVTVTSVGTQAMRTALAAKAAPGDTILRVRNINGLSVGDSVMVGTPANWKTYTITSTGTQGPNGTGIGITPSLAEPHAANEECVKPGTGLELAAPLKFNHAANIPFSARGTGITFQPATTFAHSSNEPVQPLGTGVTLDAPLAHNHPIEAAVRDASVTTAGYQGAPQPDQAPRPDQWFGGPALSQNAGSMVLRDAAGLVVDSLNYGLLVDPWAAEGYQAESGASHGGCRVMAPAPGSSAGRFPDGADTDSNCNDFHTEPATTLAADAQPGSDNIKVTGVAGFRAGQRIRIDAGAATEAATVAVVGTAGATTLALPSDAGATVLNVRSLFRLPVGQHVSVGSGTDAEEAVVAATNRNASTMTVEAPLHHSHAAGSVLAGTGITLTAQLRQTHSTTTPVAGAASTPGAANHYSR